MRVHYVLLLAASAFFASAEADAVATDSALGASTSGHRFIAEKNDVSVSRSLRATATAPEADEERKIFFDKLVNFIMQKSLEEMLLEWKVKGKSSDYTLQMLGLQSKNNVAKLFDDPRFVHWVEYVKDTTKVDPDGAAVVTLMKHYKNIDLYRLLNAAMEDVTRKNLAMRWQSKLVEKWLESTYDKAGFRELLLDILNERKSFIWVEHPNELVSVSQAKLGDRDLATLLETAVNNSPDRILAAQLQQIQLESWAKRGDDPVKAFSLICREDGAILVDKLNLQVWFKYVEHLMRMKRDERLSSQLIDIVQKSDDDIFTTALSAMKKGESDETGEEQLIKRWVQEKLHPEDVSWVLGAKALEEGSQEHEFLTSYRKAFNKEQKSAFEVANDHP